MSHGVTLPDGFIHLHGALHLIPFEAICSADGNEESEEYSFKNPRALTEKGQADLMDRNSSETLRADIRDNTLMQPFICRWVEKDGQIKPQLVGGDRRYRAIDYLKNQKVLVKDANSAKLNKDGEYEYEFRPADSVYEKVLCQVFSAADDLDALGLAYSENNCRKNLTEGHDIAICQELRRCNATDEKILQIMKKDVRWLRDTDNLLNNLDGESLQCLIEDRIDRDSAKELLTIEDSEIRSQILAEANAESETESKKRKKKFQKRVEAALQEEELASGEVAIAEDSGKEESVVIANTNLEEKSAKVKRTVADRDEEKSVTKKKHVVSATKSVTGEDSTAKRALRTPKIKEHYVSYLEQVIENEGKCPDGKFTADVEMLTFGLEVAKAIMDGEIDCAKVCKEYAGFEESN